MTAPLYDCKNSTAIALAAATAKTVLGAKAHANSGLLLTGYKIGFDGVTASAVPVLWEVVYCTWATNAPATNSSTITPLQRNGRSLAVGFTAGENWSVEPTVVTPLFGDLLTPNGGAIIVDLPYGQEMDCNLAEGFAIRLTAPAVVNVRCMLTVARC